MPSSDLAEDRVTPAVRIIEIGIVSVVDEELASGRVGIVQVRAMAIVPRLFESPLPDSFLIGARLPSCFSCI